MKVHQVINTLGGIALAASLFLFVHIARSQDHQPRTLGNTAVMHIYYYAPKTLEITYVDSYLFKDEAACKGAISSALRIAMPLASKGDLVNARCIGMTPPSKSKPKDDAPPTYIQIGERLIPSPESNEPGIIFMFTDCRKPLLLESITGDDWRIALAFHPHFEKAWGLAKELQDAGKNVETIEVRKNCAVE